MARTLPLWLLVMSLAVAGACERDAAGRLAFRNSKVATRTISNQTQPTLQVLHYVKNTPGQLFLAADKMHFYIAGLAAISRFEISTGTKTSSIPNTEGHPISRLTLQNDSIQFCYRVTGVCWKAGADLSDPTHTNLVSLDGVLELVVKNGTIMTFKGTHYQISNDTWATTIAIPTDKGDADLTEDGRWAYHQEPGDGGLVELWDVKTGTKRWTKRLSAVAFSCEDGAIVGLEQAGSLVHELEIDSGHTIRTTKWPFRPRDYKNLREFYCGGLMSYGANKIIDVESKQQLELRFRPTDAVHAEALGLTVLFSENSGDVAIVGRRHKHADSASSH